MPNPHAGESQEAFLSRFMGSPEAESDFPDKKQRAAVAYSMWRELSNDMDNAKCAVCATDFKDWTLYRNHMKDSHNKDLMAVSRANAANAKWEDLSEDEKEAMMKIMGQPAARKNEDEKFCDKCGIKFTPPFYAKGVEEQYCQACFKGRRNSRGQAGRVVPMRFIEPGLVNYSDVGMVLVRKETLDKMLNSIVGKPIFNESHKDVSDEDFEGRAQGILAGNPRFNPNDGWYWVDALIWDDETIKNARQGYSLSCAYDVTRWGAGGIHNNIPYDREVLEGEYTHLAIVNNPRYEGARLIINQGGAMKLKFWEKENDEKPREMELVNAKTDVNGVEMPLEKVIELANSEIKRQEDLKNSNATDDSIIEVAGKKMTVKDAKKLAATAMKNAADDDDKKKKEKEDEERKNAEEKEKKEKEERENAKNEEDHEKGEHKDKSMDNCLACKSESARKNAQHFDDLRNARNKGQEEFREPGLKTAAERIEEGNRRYGSVKP